MIVYGDDDTYRMRAIMIKGASYSLAHEGSGSNSTSDLILSWTENGVSWYSDGDYTGNDQLNYKKIAYQYAAIG